MVKHTSMNLFDDPSPSLKASAAGKPLAERLRPVIIDDFIGQAEVIAHGTLLRHALEHDELFSMILWGPPGCGKTTLAGILAQATRSHFERFSAVLSGVKEIRTVITVAEKHRLTGKRTILFVDEIHRFNKAQQDAFLHHVENGLITLIGATTENPSYEIIAPLLSRCTVIPLKPLKPEDIGCVLDRALTNTALGLGMMNITLEPEARLFLIEASQGDARAALNNLELAAAMLEDSKTDSPCITLKTAETALRRKALLYDKSGEEHFNLISAFHKSLRGSDPDAGLYWLSRMIEAGEDPLYIARRMVRFASEDVGLADPLALCIALNAMESFRFLGKPEGELALAQAAVYLATAPKSNSIYKAYGSAKQAVEQYGYLPVPLHIRNAPTALMKTMGYGKDYKYAHDYQDAYTHQTYLPEKIKDIIFFEPYNRGYEKIIQDKLRHQRSLTKDKPEKDKPEEIDSQPSFS